jgi:signal transduction histidine kinase
MILTWGPEFTQIYNDAYAKLIGDKHPQALGDDIRITMAENWDTLGPMIERVMETGQANWTAALPLLMDRSGYREEAYFSVSHAPAENDEGIIVGMLAVCSEVTVQVVGERRLKLLSDLSTQAGEIRSVETTSEEVGKALASDLLDLPFALLYLRGPEENLNLAAATSIAPDSIHASSTLPIAYDAANQPWPLTQALAGQPQTLTGLSKTLGLHGGLWQDLVDCAQVIPIAGESDAEPLGVLVLGISPSRALDEAYRTFITLVAGQISMALRNARAYEQAQQRAEMLAELDRAKTQFFSNVSHEFRTPPTLMLGPLEDLLGKPTLPPEVRDELTVAHRNALRLLRLVNTLLDFSRVEAGRSKARFIPTNLASFTTDLASSFRSAIERAGLRFEVICPPLPEPVFVDREMWEKVVLNLLSNAFKFTFTGQIRLELSSNENHAQLTVADTGVGIAAEHLPRLFERFHRIEGTKSRSYEGSGIGLALVNELVMLHGGSVSVNSPPDQGTVFTLKIPFGSQHLPDESIHDVSSDYDEGPGAAPFVEEALRWLADDTQAYPLESSTAQAVTVAAKHSTKRRARIVLADDNADMRAYIQRLLEPDHDIIAVADGAIALDVVRQHGADLLLTDVMMPILDGFGLVRQLREDPLLKTLPIIMLSARAGEEASVDGLESGADDYLVKPFSARELKARVQASLELAQLRREAEEQLAQSRKMDAIGQLTAGVAHDFNNLLAVVIASLDLMALRTTDERTSHLLKNAQQAADRGAKLTTQLLAFSRKQRLNARPVDLNTMLLGMKELLHSTLGGTVELVMDLQPGLWIAQGDSNQLELAILNMVVNARDAMPGGGTLTIQTQNVGPSDTYPASLGRGEFISVSLTDTGEGMSQDVLSHLFEPFFTTKAQGKGTGLGLAQVYGTVRQFGGDIEVRSLPGRGTRICFYLPRTSEPVQAMTEPVKVGLSPAVPLRILLVDDDAQVRRSTSAMLTELGYEHIKAASGQEAIQQLQDSEGIDLLLTDYAMPGMTGMELCKQSLGIRPELKMLLMTGYADSAALPTGSLTVLNKPFTLNQLADTIINVVSHKQKIKLN